MRNIIIVFGLFFSLNSFSQLSITYYEKCDQLVFTNGINSSDTTYSIFIKPDSIYHLDYEYYNDVRDSSFIILPEDLDTNYTTGEIFVDIDSLIAMPDYWVDAPETYYHSIYSIDRYLVVLPPKTIKREDLDSTMYVRSTCDTSYYTILQACDTCTNKNIDCYNTYSSGSWHNACVDNGWTVIADRLLKSQYRLSLMSSPYPIFLYVEAQNKCNMYGKQWLYLYIVPNDKAIRYRNKITCTDYKIIYTKRHTIYSSSCALKDI